MKNLKLYINLLEDFKKLGEDTKTIKKECKQCFKIYKQDFYDMTELACVLHNLSMAYETDKKSLSNLYNRLFEDVNDYVILEFKDRDLDYYFDRVGWED